ncbi:MAG: hypothetical protein KKC55_16130 [Gammaproteobacteria bacterium]|nr:hypothetical protein [Gammaproteobacteria bacterium]
MQNIGSYQPPVGGRKSSPKIRGMLQIASDFEGLPEGVDRLDLLHLVKDVGSYGGFTQNMVALLEYYVMFTRDCDWAQGGRPIVYQSLVKTARKFRVSERQIQYLENALANAGALTWDSSGNNKRFGFRDPSSGEIVYAYGVDLSPLAALREQLERQKSEREALDEAWYATKRKISWYRARIRSLIAEAKEAASLERAAAEAQHGYEGIDGHIRSYMSLDDLNALLDAHSRLHDELKATIEADTPAQQTCGLINDLTENSSSTDDNNFVHKYSTNNPLSLKRDTCSPLDGDAPKGSVVDSSQPKDNVRSGGEVRRGDWMAAIAEEMGRISWKQVLAAGSERFREHLPMHERALSWPDIVEAAYQLLPILGISKSAWLDACMTLGRDGAALCIIIIDQKVQDPKCNIRNPGGYLRTMTARAKTGDLNLHRSVFGLLKRGRDQYDS